MWYASVFMISYIQQYIKTNFFKIKLYRKILDLPAGCYVRDHTWKKVKKRCQAGIGDGIQYAVS